jgi:hypothetical protein
MDQTCKVLKAVCDETCINTNARESASTIIHRLNSIPSSLTSECLSWYHTALLVGLGLSLLERALRLALKLSRLALCLTG